MGTVTIGVSIAVPEPHGSQLQERRAGFGDAAAAGIPTHVTLLPPTEIEAAALPAVEAHLAGVAADAGSFTMRLSGTGTFRPLSPVVFVRIVAGAGACTWLQDRVRAPSGPLARELQFPYHPHVTVAHGIEDASLDRAQQDLAHYEAGWTCTAFALYEQGVDGTWRRLRDFAFGDAATPAQDAAPAGQGAEPTR